jgi:hypothetical protein
MLPCADGPEQDPEPDYDCARSGNLNLIPHQGRTDHTIVPGSKVQRSSSVRLRAGGPNTGVCLAPCLPVFTVTSDTHGFTHSLTLKTNLQ